jgi:predicted RNA-binding protein YlqC (UPF0109 family)
VRIAFWSAAHVGRVIWKVGRTASAVVQVVLTPVGAAIVLDERADGNLMR